MIIAAICVISILVIVGGAVIIAPCMLSSQISREEERKGPYKPNKED